MMFDDEQRDQAITANIERAMRHLARAAALADEGAGQAHVHGRFTDELGHAHTAGLFYGLARMVCSELGRDFDNVASGARSYANNVQAGTMHVL